MSASPSMESADSLALLTFLGPGFWGSGAIALLRRSDRFACFVQLGCDRLHLGGNAIEGALQADVVADVVCAALLDELLDVLLGLAGGAQLLTDLVVRHFDPELVRHRFEQELSRH